MSSPTTAEAAFHLLVDTLTNLRITKASFLLPLFQLQLQITQQYTYGIFYPFFLWHWSENAFPVVSMTLLVLDIILTFDQEVCSSMNVLIRSHPIS